MPTPVHCHPKSDDFKRTRPRIDTGLRVAMGSCLVSGADLRPWWKGARVPHQAHSWTVDSGDLVDSTKEAVFPDDIAYVLDGEGVSLLQSMSFCLLWRRSLLRPFQDHLRGAVPQLVGLGRWPTIAGPTSLLAVFAEGRASKQPSIESSIVQVCNGAALWSRGGKFMSTSSD